MKNNFIEKLKQLNKKIFIFFDDDSVSLEYKNLYITAIVGTPISILLVLIFAFSGVSEMVIYEGVLFLVFLFSIIYLMFRFKNVSVIKYIFVLSFNFLFMPQIYLITGDIYNGAALFFPVGIILTFFLIQSKIVYLLVVAEFVWDIYIVLLPSRHYFAYDGYRQVNKLGIGIVFSFLMSSSIVVMIIMYQMKIFGRTRNKISHASQIIEDADDNKSRFLANMTNEIRTPMNSIIGMNELILKEDINPEARELAESIRESSNHLLKIINNILEYSKLDAGRMELYPNRYDFKELINSVIVNVSAEYSSKNTEFFVDIDPNIPRFLFGDTVRIKQVFLYILFSAINKLPHNRISLRISGDIDRSTNICQLSCTISESGMGLTQEEIDALMSAYTRYDSRQKTDYRDMGLEFSISKKILELMGGSISIESIEDIGMTVKFDFVNYIIEELPLVKLPYFKDFSILVYCEDRMMENIWSKVLSSFQLVPTFVFGPNAFRAAIENKSFTHIFIDDVFYNILKDTINTAGISDKICIVSDSNSKYSDFDKLRLIRRPINCINVIETLSNEWKPEGYKLAVAKEMVVYPDARVLIVDDSTVNLKVLESILKTFKLNVTKAKSGEAALTILNKEEFDMLIFDQQMPGMDGSELLRNTKKLPNSNSLAPVICATADFGPEVERTLIEQGFNDYLAKPIRKHYLERMLRSYLPVSLAINVVASEDSDNAAKAAVKEDTSNKAAQPEVKKEDPLIIHFEDGLNNLGGNLEAFGAVVESYYNEGMAKLKSVPPLLESDKQLYVVEVHALKSSSAAIGAKAISEEFKSLEFAGRADNMEFLSSHTKPTFDSFELVLEKVKAYLLENNLMSESAGDDEPAGDVLALNKDSIQEAYDALAKFNLKACEDKLNELTQSNYGPELNGRLKDIKGAYDMFDYHKVKDELKSLLENM